MIFKVCPGSAPDTPQQNRVYQGRRIFPIITMIFSQVLPPDSHPYASLHAVEFEQRHVDSSLGPVHSPPSFAIALKERDVPRISAEAHMVARKPPILFLFCFI